MFILRGLAASLLWLVAGLLGLLGVVLSVTVVLLPLGVPLLLLAKKVFGYSMALLVPRKARHPVSEGRKAAKAGGRKAVGKGKEPVGALKKTGSKALRWLTS
jgi:hypothetical protein